jgi:transporter family protein
MSLLALIALATISYALFDIFASRAGNAIDANLSSVIFNGLGMFLPLVLYIFYKSVQGTQLIATTTSGIVYSLLAGVSIAAFSVLLIKIFEQGDLAYVVPLIYGGAIVLTALVGWAVYQESISWLQAFGILVVVVGVAIIVVSKFDVAS